MTEARQRIRLRGVTDALRLDDGRVVQVLEGDAASIAPCVAQIPSGSRHDRITLPHRGPIQPARLPEWSMRHVSLDGRAASPMR